MKLNVVIGMKHFIQLIMVTNFAIHKIVVPLPHLKKFLTKSHRIIHGKKKIRKISTKTKEGKGKDKNTVFKEKEEYSKLLKKERVI